MTTTDKPKELLESILKLIVDKPKEVEVIKTVDEMGVLLEVKMNQEDAGLVIGRGGRTIQAIRTVIGIIGMKIKARINIKLDVPERKEVKSEKKSGIEDLDL